MLKVPVVFARYFAMCLDELYLDLLLACTFTVCIMSCNVGLWSVEVCRNSS